MAFRARYVRVVVDTDAPGLPQPFTYLVPDHLNVEIGDAVLVPFGPSRELIGYVVGLDDKCDPAFVDKLKPLAGVIDGARLFDSDLWAVAQWVTNQTLAELRDSIRLIAPPIASARIQTSVSIPDAATAREPHNEAEVEILERVSAGKPVSWAQLTSPSESSAKAVRWCDAELWRFTDLWLPRRFGKSEYACWACWQRRTKPASKQKPFVAVRQSRRSFWMLSSRTSPGQAWRPCLDWRLTRDHRQRPAHLPLMDWPGITKLRFAATLMAFE
jgi:primosomal protein N'